MAKKNEFRQVNEESVKTSLFEDNTLTGKPLSEYDRPKVAGTVDAKEYIDELRSARHLTDKDYSVRITVQG